MLGKMRLAFWLAIFAIMLFAQQQGSDALFRRAVEAQQAGDYPAAIDTYRRLLTADPDFFEALANLGAALVHEGKFDQAVAEYKAALKLRPGDTALQRNLGLAFYKEGDFRDASDEFAALYKAAPDDVRNATLLADCYSRLGQNDRAVALLDPLQRSNSDNLDLLYVLGSALIHSGRRHDGALLIDRVARRGESADAYLLAGSTWIDLNEFDKARQDLDAALRLNSNLPGIRTFSGILKDKMGDAQGAATELRKAVDLDGNDFLANLNLGALLYKQRNLDEAERYLRHAVALNPSSVLARYELALYENAVGQVTAAVQELEAVTRADPNWLEPHIQLAALYYKLHRQEDGLKERHIVEGLTAAQQNPASRYRAFAPLNL